MARTLLIDDWTYHTARVHKKNRQDYQPSNVLGIDVLDFVEKALPVRASFDKKEKQRRMGVLRNSPSGMENFPECRRY